VTLPAVGARQGHGGSPISGGGSVLASPFINRST
jgi:hypothetical protein